MTRETVEAILGIGGISLALIGVLMYITSNAMINNDITKIRNANTERTLQWFRDRAEWKR